jgi:hypothetical protein
MYVMSSLPSTEQSIAGGIFNTVSKICSTLSLGITTAIYNSMRNQGNIDSIRPYRATYWFSAAAAGFSILLVPFLILGTQGDSAKILPVEIAEGVEIAGEIEKEK